MHWHPPARDESSSDTEDADVNETGRSVFVNVPGRRLTLWVRNTAAAPQRNTVYEDSDGEGVHILAAQTQPRHLPLIETSDGLTRSSQQPGFTMQEERLKLSVFSASRLEAKRQSLGSRADLERLNEDIRVAVIQKVADIEGALEPPRSIIDVLIFLVRSEEQYSSSQQTLRALTITSHWFRSIALPMLLRYVKITSKRQLYSLATMLEQSTDAHFAHDSGLYVPGGSMNPRLLDLPRSPDTEGRGYGRFIKRIDLQYSPDCGNLNAVDNTVVTDLTRLIRQSVNLAILGGDLPFRLSWTVPPLLPHISKPQSIRLLTIRFGSECALLIFTGLADSGAFNRLETLRMKVDDFPPVAMQSFRLVLPELRRLRFDLKNAFVAYSMQSWVLPKLNIVYLFDPHLAHFDLFLQFAARLSHTICSVAIEGVIERPTAVEELVRILPELKEIVYNPFILERLTTNHPKLERCGWSYVGHDPGDRQTNPPLDETERPALEDQLTSLLEPGRFPNFRVLHFMGDYSSSYENISHTGERMWWVEFLDRARRGGIEVVDCKGDPIRVPLGAESEGDAVGGMGLYAF